MAPALRASGAGDTMTRTRMRRIGRFAAHGALVATLLVSAVVANGVARTPRHGSATFRISGNVAGLVPGRPVQMRVQVSNRFSFPIVVTRLAATVTSPTPACPAGNLTVRPWRGSLRVSAHRVRTVVLRVTLRRAAPIGCAGLDFTLRFNGRAARAAA